MISLYGVVAGEYTELLGLIPLVTEVKGVKKIVGKLGNKIIEVFTFFFKTGDKVKTLNSEEVLNTLVNRGLSDEQIEELLTLIMRDQDKKAASENAAELAEGWAELFFGSQGDEATKAWKLLQEAGEEAGELKGDLAAVKALAEDVGSAGNGFLLALRKPGMVRVWEKIYPHVNRTSIPILTRRIEFDELPSQWRKENPYNNQDMFDPNSGEYTALHTGHNDYPHEYDMADAIAKDGKAVKLCDESTPDPAFGNRTPDADIDGVVYDFKNFDSPNNVNGKVYNHIISGGSRSNAPGVTFNLQGNSASLADVNQGLDDVRLLISNNGVPSGMADQVGLVYSDGSVAFLTKDEIINGATF